MFLVGEGKHIPVLVTYHTMWSRCAVFSVGLRRLHLTFNCSTIYMLIEPP
jgi:hypothetical protein